MFTDNFSNVWSYDVKLKKPKVMNDFSSAMEVHTSKTLESADFWGDCILLKAWTDFWTVWNWPFYYVQLGFNDNETWYGCYGNTGYGVFKRGIQN